MKNETRNDEAVSPVIATILMVAITVVLAGVLYVWAANLAESNTDGSLELYTFSGADAPGSDGAVIMTMDSGSDIGWASVTIKASVDGVHPQLYQNVEQMTETAEHTALTAGQLPKQTKSGTSVKQSLLTPTVKHLHNYHQRSKQQRGNNP